jgi:hypothetical protein
MLNLNYHLSWRLVVDRRGRVGDLAMKGFLFLSLVGAALYVALVVSNDLIITAEDPSVRQNLGDPDSRQLRSWGSDLPALVNSSSEQASLPLRKPC